MRDTHPLLRVGGPVLGLLIVWYLVNIAVTNFQSDLEAMREAPAAEESAAEGEAAGEATEGESSEAETSEEPAAGEDAAAQPSAAEETSEPGAADEGGDGEQTPGSEDVGTPAAETDEAGTPSPTAQPAATPGDEGAASGGETGDGEEESPADESAQEEPGANAQLAVAAMTGSGCGGCHVIPGVPGAVGVVGPDLSNIGVDAAERREGYSAEEYIHESIVLPNEYIVETCPIGPCPPNVMLQSFAESLSEEELDAIVAYLLTLRTGE